MEGTTEAFEALLESIHFFGGWFMAVGILWFVLRSIGRGWNDL